MEPVVVVGAGIAGVACARVLIDAGLPVRLVDRGRRVGGRMASRRLEGRPVDLGASYLTVSDARFGSVVERWEAAGLARPWTETFHVLAPDGEPTTKDGPVRWGTPHGLRSLVEDLAAGLEVSSATEVSRVARAADGSLDVDGRPAAAVVLALPDPQARRLLAPGLASSVTLDRTFEPVLALAARWPERAWDLDGAFVNDHDALAWVADDGRRRGDGAPVLVAHSTPALAAPYLDDPQSAAPLLTAALRDLLGLGEPAATHLHRWSFARPTGERPEPYLLTDDAAPLAACGDGWGPQSKVEGAWLSGTALGEALTERLA